MRMAYHIGKSQITQEWYNKFMNATIIETCYYCNNPAEFNDIAPNGENYVVAGVCLKHLKNYGNA